MAVASTCFSADQVLDRVVAQVDGQVITLSDLRFEARVAMVERGGGALADAPLDEATLQSARLAQREGDAVAAKALRAEIQALMATDDAREGLQSFLERRVGRFTGR